MNKIDEPPYIPGHEELFFKSLSLAQAQGKMK
jgi:hypothetical protein